MSKSKSGYRRVKWLFGKEIEIPEEWEIHTVESVSKKIVSGGTPSTTMLEYWNGNIPWTRSSVLLDPYLKSGEKFITAEGLRNSSSVLIPKNNLLVSSRVSVGNISISAIDVAISQDVTGIIINKAYARSEFLYWYLKQHIKKLVLISQGTTIQGFTRKELAKLLVFLPSLSEQQKIASIFSGVDALIESTQRTIEKTERLKKGLMQNLLTRGIGHTKYKKVLIKYHFLELEIPKRWQIKSIKELSTLKKNAVMTGPFGLMLHSSDYVDEGIPLILIKNLKNGKLDEKDIPKISEKDAKRLYKYQVRAGDIVFSRVGRVGSASLIEKEHDGWLISGQMLRIRFENSNLNPYFVNYFINSRLFVRVLTPELLGSTRDSINTTILENLLIVIPSIHEQEKIASILSEVDAYIQKNQQYKEKLEKLKKGLMQKLLTGQIRVRA